MENNIFELTINGKPFKTESAVVTGKQILEFLGLSHSTDYEILSKTSESEFEPVEVDESVDLKGAAFKEFRVKPYREIFIEVDAEKYPVVEVLMTAKEIMVLADLDPEKHYLKQIIGHTDISYKNDPNHVIGIVDCMKFSSCKIANTTVS